MSNVLATNVLEKIVEDKKVTVAQLKESLPLDSFIHGLKPTTKDLYAELSKENAGFILECKKASPSKGLIRADFDVVAIAKTYDKYAAGISVLTDEKYFQGTFDYLQQVTKTVTAPVLNKDFFIDTYQVYLARYYGADAILLMLSVLDDTQYRALADVANQFNLAILTEISNEEEMQRAIDLDAKLIGINNRNLRDLSTDISRTFEFAPKLPDDRIVISESGIYTNAQVRELAPAVDGFLVGSSVMAKDDIDLACRELIYGENKVCGLSKAEHAIAASTSGAVYGGLIFADKSPRYVTLDKARNIVEQVPSLNYVGVFVNHDIDFIASTAKELSLFAVQLHGNENQTFIDNLKAKLPASCQIWKAVSVETKVPTLGFDCDHIVLDGKSPGSGESFRWQLLTDTEETLAHCFLAGGLSSENINKAIDTLTTQELYGLDINSGVESSPGEKCSTKIAEIFAQLRNY